MLLCVTLLAPFGLAQGLAMAPLMALTVSGAPAEEAGAASGAQQAAQQFGNATGIAILASLFLGLEATVGVEAAMPTTLACLGGVSLCASASARRLSALRTP